MGKDILVENLKFNGGIDLEGYPDYDRLIYITTIKAVEGLVAALDKVLLSAQGRKIVHQDSSVANIDHGTSNHFGTVNGLDLTLIPPPEGIEANYMFRFVAEINDIEINTQPSVRWIGDRMVEGKEYLACVSGDLGIVASWDGTSPYLRIAHPIVWLMGDNIAENYVESNVDWNVN